MKSDFFLFINFYIEYEKIGKKKYLHKIYLHFHIHTQMMYLFKFSF